MCIGKRILLLCLESSINVKGELCDGCDSGVR